MKNIISKITTFLLAFTMFGTFCVVANAATIQSPANSGNLSAKIVASEIPAPAYTVTIPTVIDFGEVKRVHTKTPDEGKIKKTNLLPITAEYSNLYENEKKLSVSLLATDLTIKHDSNNGLSFKLYREDQSEINGVVSVLDINPMKQDIKVIATTNLYATLDQSQIRVEGAYNGTITFTVALTDIV
ncbi:MAG: hypothetical protein RR497_05325 [Oscillospiraceae bacterium]